MKTKREELKEKIDIYFDNILATELFEIATKKYGFTESNIKLENQTNIIKLIKKQIRLWKHLKKQLKIII